MSELQAVFVDRVAVGGVYIFYFALFVEKLLVRLFCQVHAGNYEGGFGGKDGYDCYKSSLGFADIFMLFIPKELDVGRGAGSVGRDLYT